MVFWESAEAAAHRKTHGEKCPKKINFPVVLPTHSQGKGDPW